MTSRPARIRVFDWAGVSSALWILVLAGCGGPDQGGGETFTVTDSAGVVVAESTAPAWSESQGWGLSPEPLVVIGTSAADPDDQLFQVRAVARLADGRLAVLNTGTREVRYFAADGSFLFAAGGPGEGPGEMRYPFHMARGAGDTLLVNDMPFFNRYGPEGTYVRREPLEWDRVLEQAPADLRYGALREVLPDGSIFGWLTGEPEETGDAWSEDVLMMAYHPPVGQVALLDWWTWGGGTVVRWQGANRRVQHPLSPTVAWGAGGSPERARIVVGRPDAPRYHVYAPDGALLRIVRWAAEPSPVTAEIAERAMSLARASYLGDAVERFDQTTGTVPPPESLPYYFGYAGLVVDEVGNVWIRDFTVSWRDPASFTVFDAEGRWLGRVSVPPGLEHPGNSAGVTIGPDWFLGIWRNELDVQEVRLYRVRRPVP